MPVTFFPVTSPVSKTFAYLALVLRAHYAICRYMCTVGFQYNFRQTTARFSAGRRKQLVVNDMLLFWCSWFKYRFIELDLVTVGKFCFHFSRISDSVVDCINVSPSARVKLNHGLRDAHNVCAITKVGTVLKLYMDEVSEKHSNLDPPQTTSLSENQISAVRVRRLLSHLPSTDSNNSNYWKKKEK